MRWVCDGYPLQTHPRSQYIGHGKRQPFQSGAVSLVGPPLRSIRLPPSPKTAKGWGSAHIAPVGGMSSATREGLMGQARYGHLRIHINVSRKLDSRIQVRLARARYGHPDSAVNCCG